MDTIKAEARRLIDHLPDNSTLENIMCKFYVRQKIEKAIDAAKKGKTNPYKKVRKGVGLWQPN